MSDVLHHARYTATQSGAIGQRARFLARINERATALKKIPIQCAVLESAPVPIKIIWIAPEELAFGPIVHPEPEGPHTPTVQNVIKAACHHFKISRAEIFSERRTNEVVYPRHIAMYVAKKVTFRSLPFIGGKFNGRDHTTVLNAVRNMAARVAGGDPDVIFDVQSIKKYLGVSKFGTSTRRNRGN